MADCTIVSGYGLKLANGNILTLRTCELQGYCMYMPHGAVWIDAGGHEVPTPTVCGGNAPNVITYDPIAYGTTIGNHLISEWDYEHPAPVSKFKPVTIFFIILLVIVIIWRMV